MGARLWASLRQASATLASSRRSWIGTEPGAGKVPAWAEARQAKLCRAERGLSAVGSCCSHINPEASICVDPAHTYQWQAWLEVERSQQLLQHAPTLDPQVLPGGCLHSRGTGARSTEAGRLVGAEQPLHKAALLGLPRSEPLAHACLQTYSSAIHPPTSMSIAC